MDSGNRKVNGQSEEGVIESMDEVGCRIRSVEPSGWVCFSQAAQLELPSSVVAAHTCVVVWPCSDSPQHWTSQTFAFDGEGVLVGRLKVQRLLGRGIEHHSGQRRKQWGHPWQPRIALEQASCSTGPAACLGIALVTARLWSQRVIGQVSYLL